MALNTWTGIGRITKDLEPRMTASDKMVLKFTLAVDGYKKGETDFIPCVAWGKPAELIAQYCAKGSQLAVSGRLKTGSYDNKQGQKVYTMDVNVTDFQFLGGKSEPKNISQFEDMQPVDTEDLPF